MMRALEGADVVIVAAEHVRRPGKQLEIFTTQARDLVGRSQRRVCVTPRPIGVAPAAAFEFRARSSHLADYPPLS
jgi:hypothetical protein